jgi:hypothetical protein
MEFKPKSEKEIMESNLAPEGDYDFNILAAEDTVSKSKNAMIKVKLGLYSGESIRWHIFDYLVPAMEAKLRHFCDSVGLLSQYEAGTLCAEDCKGRAGKVRIIIKSDKSGQFPDKNEVKDYVLRAAKPLTKPEPKPVEEADDVPF